MFFPRRSIFQRLIAASANVCSPVVTRRWGGKYLWKENYRLWVEKSEDLLTIGFLGSVWMQRAVAKGKLRCVYAEYLRQAVYTRLKTLVTFWFMFLSTRTKLSHGQPQTIPLRLQHKLERADMRLTLSRRGSLGELSQMREHLVHPVITKFSEGLGIARCLLKGKHLWAENPTTE